MYHIILRLSIPKKKKSGKTFRFFLYLVRQSKQISISERQGALIFHVRSTFHIRRSRIFHVRFKSVT